MHNEPTYYLQRLSSRNAPWKTKWPTRLESASLRQAAAHGRAGLLSLFYALWSGRVTRYRLMCEDASGVQGIACTKTYPFPTKHPAFLVETWRAVAREPGCFVARRDPAATAALASCLDVDAATQLFTQLPTEHDRAGKPLSRRLICIGPGRRREVLCVQ